MERQEMASRSEKSQLDSECSELRRQIRDLKETVVKDSQIWENDRTSLCRQLELVRSLIPVAFLCSCLMKHTKCLYGQL